jgi:hypothetical protein
MDGERTNELRTAAAGAPGPRLARRGMDAPTDPAEHLRWFIDNDLPPTGSGPNGLADFCQQTATFWERKDESNVHLFHYHDLCHDLDGEMRRLVQVLDVDVDDRIWPELVHAATLDSMRSRATNTAPEAHLALWHDPQRFFRTGGTRDWASLLTADDLAHFNERLTTLAGHAAPWILAGRAGLGIDS